MGGSLLSNNFEVALVFKAVDETGGVFTATVKGLDKVAAKTRDMLGAAGGAGDGVAKAMDKAGSATRKVGQQAEAAGTQAAGAVRKLGREAEDAGNRTERAFRKPARVLEELRQKAQGLTDGLRNAGIGVMATGGAMVASLYQPVQAWSEMEAVMTQARLPFMKTGGTDPIWTEIQPIIERLGQQLPGTSADFGEIAGSMRSAGLAARDIRDGGLEAAAALKILGKMSNEEAGFLSVQMSRALKVEGHDFKAFADELQRTSFAAGISIREMATAIPYMGSQLRLFKINGLPGAQAVTTAMAMLKDAGVSGTEIGSAMAGLLDRLPVLQDRLIHGRGWKTRESAGLMQKYNLGNLGAQLFDSKGDLRGEDGLTRMANIVTVFDRMNRSITSTKDKALLFEELLGDIGKRAGVAFTVENWNASRKKILEQADLQSRLNEVLKTQASLWEAAAGTGRIFLATVAEPLAPIIKGLTQGLNDLTGKLIDWTRAHPKLTAAIGGTVAVAGGLALLVGGLLLTVGMLGKLVLAASTGMANWTAVATLTRTALRGVAKDAVVAAAGVETLAAAQAEAAASSYAAAWGGVGVKSAARGAGAAAAAAPAAGGGILAGIVGSLSGAASAIGGVVAGITLPIALAIAAAAALVYIYWEPIKGFFKGLGAGFVADFKPVLDIFDTICTALGSITNALGGLREVFGSAREGAEGLNGAFKAGSAVGSFFAGVVKLIAYLVQGAVQGVEALVITTVTLIDTLATAANFLSNLVRGKLGAAKQDWSAFSTRFWKRLDDSSWNSNRPTQALAGASKIGSGADLKPQAMPAGAGAPGQGVQINYNPKIELSGSATPDDEARLMRILERHKEEVAALVAKVQERGGRWNKGEM